MEAENKKFINLIKSLSKVKYVKIEGIKFEISNIEETEFDEYCLTLKLGDYLYEGIYIRTEKKLSCGKK